MRPRRFARFVNWWRRSPFVLASWRRTIRRGLCAFFLAHGGWEESIAAIQCRRCGKIYSKNMAVIERYFRCRVWPCKYKDFFAGFVPENGYIMQLFDVPPTFPNKCVWCRHAMRYDALDKWIDCQLRPLRKIRNALCRFICASVPTARRCSFVRRHGTGGGVPLVS